MNARAALTNNSILTNNGTITLAGDLTNNGTINSGGSSLLTFDDSGTTVSISGSGNTNLNDVTFSNFDATIITTTNQVKVARVATVQGYDLTTNDQLRLTSNATTSTGMIATNGGGQIIGDITVERAIDTRYNGSNGYRHYSTPVTGPLVKDLYVPGAFRPKVDLSFSYPFNNTMTPFPNVFYYDESQVPTTPDYYGCPLPSQCYTIQKPCDPYYKPFEYGWRCPDSTSALVVGLGYTLQINSGAKIALTGTANDGDYYTDPLGRGGNVNSGWHLVGNPYPSPIDAYTTMSDNLYDITGNPDGFDATVYFFRSYSSTGPNTCNPVRRISNGTYQYINTYTTQTGYYDEDGNPVPDNTLSQYFPVMQGFFVRKTDGTNATPFYFNNSQRINTYTPSSGTITPFYRPAAGTTTPRATPRRAAPAPTAHVQLNDTQDNLRDYVQVSFRADATVGHDAKYDVVRPGDNVENPTLFTVNADKELCALNTLPTLSGTTRTPLGLRTLIAGHTYTLRVSKHTLAPGTRVYLDDQETGRITDLTDKASFTFVAHTNNYENRFVIRFENGTAKALPTAEAGKLIAYPNPGQTGAPLEFRAEAVRGTTAQATLLNSFGRVVSTQTVTVRDGQAVGNLTTASLKPGIYLLRLTTADNVTTQRIEIR